MGKFSNLRVLLVAADIGVAVSVLNAHYEVADDENVRTIVSELLVGHFCIVFLRLDVLVEVKVVGVAQHKLAGAHEYLHEKCHRKGKNREPTNTKE